MLTVDLKPDNAAVAQVGRHSMTIAYRTVTGSPYLTVNPAKSRIMMWIPMVDHHDLTVVLADQFVVIRLLRLKGPAPIIRLEAHESLDIIRLERAPSFAV